ncbi:hypothetical protein J6X04_02220 [Candidatus Saccharibacteria bacterium]|nr:hypothetical protein [Candidatus Saccharibacteria bacterium]
MKNAEKNNIFGRSSRTPGQNLIIAITNVAECPIGIPPYNYQKMFKIFDSALTKEEKDLLLRGFGFNCEKQLQKQIAAESNMDPNQISKMAHKAIKKLQASPYKGQLKKLVPDIKEIYELAEKGLRFSGEDQEKKELFFRLQSSKENEARLSQTIKAYSEKLARAQHEQESLQKQLAEAKSDNKMAAKTISSLEEKLAAKNEALASARERYRQKEAEIFGEEATTNSFTLQSLGLSDKLIASLNAVGIKDIATLCSLSSQALSKMSIGQKGISDIKSALKTRGLSLKK